jgi:hypothetical protein
MLSILVCGALFAGAQGSLPGAAPRGITYRVKVATTNGLVATPIVYTQDNKPATVRFTVAPNRTFAIDLLPHVEPGGGLSTELAFSVNGAQASQLLAKSTVTYFKVSPSVQSGTKFVVVNATESAPDIKGEEVAVSVTGTLAANEVSELFKPHHATNQGTELRQILYEVELSDANHVITKPRVRTLDGMPARISMSGPSGSSDIQLLPDIDRAGNLHTLMLVTINSEEVFNMECAATPKRPMMFKVTREDHGLTTRIVGVQGRRKPRLKSGDLLITLSAAVVN